MERFNPKTQPKGINGRRAVARPLLYLGYKGLFQFNFKSAALMSAQVGEAVEIIRDNQKWYVTKSAVGYPLHKQKNGALCFSCLPVKKILMADLGKGERETQSLRLKPEPIHKDGFQHPFYEIDTQIS